MGIYSLNNAWEKARQRLRGLEARYDPGTIRHLETLGVGEGWHCLEVGGGGGTIAKWLCQRVGPTGHVLATDLDTRFLETLDYPSLEVRRHDIVADHLPEHAFGLIHDKMHNGATVSSIASIRDNALSRSGRCGSTMRLYAQEIGRGVECTSHTLLRGIFDKPEARQSKGG